MNTMDNERWHRRQIAFSYRQIAAFVSIFAMDQRDADRMFTLGSAFHNCLASGFYFFAISVKDELNPDLAEGLLDLAIRAEAASHLDVTGNEAMFAKWERNAIDAKELQEEYSMERIDYRAMRDGRHIDVVDSNRQ
jgi:hypothetical protein